ncbi:MAG TPA: hypothetical protein PK728_08380 [Bacillota bacterium]|nr:hypothetical protein [Bacillota bacterium]
MKKTRPKHNVYAMSPSLCFTCANAVPQLCRWISEGDLSSATKFFVKSPKGQYRIKPLDLYYILECRNYKKGPLPELLLRETTVRLQLSI